MRANEIRFSASERRCMYAIIISHIMASYRGIEFSDVVDGVLASDWELSGEEDLPDSVSNYERIVGIATQQTSPQSILSLKTKLQ